ncbi:MAG: mycothiol synthase [Actinobacteria bacterium]|nr:mycothiol synthase [Actinomycetota bacterium]
MARIESRTVLDRQVLDEILHLIEATTDLDGHRPVGEHKYSHLKVGATGWLGVLARDDEGTLIGYAHTRWGSPGQRPRVAVEVVVHPDARRDGVVATQLLDETRTAVARAGGGLMFLWVHRVEQADQTLAYELGFEIQRELAFMVRPLEERPARAVLAEGIELRPYREGRDDDAFLAVNNAAFAGHPENGGWDADDFAERRSLDWFEPDDLLMAWRGDDLVGFHWTKWHGHESDEVPAHEPVGEVYVLAVAPSAQGLGLGRSLLEIGVEHLWERGCRQVILYVDCASSAALALYESAGFEHRYRDVCYQQWIDAAVEDAAVELRRPS